MYYILWRGLAGVEGNPAGSQSNKVVRGCFAGCKFGPRGLSVFPSFPLSLCLSLFLSLSPVRCASHPLTPLESVHELPGHTKILPLPTDTDDISTTRSSTLPAFFQSRSTKKAFRSRKVYLSRIDYLYLRYVRNDFKQERSVFTHDEPLTK